jgi:phosphatidylglycerophosphatase C
VRALCHDSRAPGPTCYDARVRSVAVFDLDDTLIRGDSFAGFVRSLVLHDAWRTALAVVLMPVLLVLRVAAPLRAFASAFLWIGTVGLGHQAFRARLEGYADAAARDRERLVVRTGLETLERHRRAGHRVVVATGSASDLAAAVCRRLGLGDVEIVGSTLRPWAGGLVADDHCHGVHKVRMLAARGVAPPWDFVYTDSDRDVPLLQGGLERFLVNPSERARRRVDRACGTACTVLDWR